jgi:hypothetical protein
MRSFRFQETFMCSRIVAALLLVAAVLTTDGGVAWAQEAGGSPASPLADVYGVVRSEAGLPVPNARVEMQGPVDKGVSSDANGAFDLRVPAGVYRVVVTKSGYQTATNASLVVSGAGVETDIQLVEQSVGTLQEIGRVSTTAGASHFNTTPTSITTVDAQTIQDQGTESLSQILSEIPSVSVGSPHEWYNALGLITGPGNFINPQIRGALSYETAEELDGFPLVTGDSSFGFNAGLFTTIGLKGIQVIKGPGADSTTINSAVGGIVNFLTISPTPKNHLTASASTDGYGGSILKSQATGTIGKLGYAFGYAAANSPGPLTGRSGLFAGDTADLIVNGTQISSCSNSPTACPSTSFPNPTNPAYSSSTLNSVYCCVPLLSLSAQSSKVGKLVYHFSPLMSLDVAYLGTQLNANYGGYRGAYYFGSTFTPPAGYTGSIPAGSTVNAFEQDGTVSTQQQTQNIIETNFKAKIGPGYLHAGYLSLFQYENYQYDTGPPNTYTAYGGITTGGTPPTLVQIANGVPVQVYYNFTFLESELTKDHAAIVDYRVPIGDNSLDLSWTQSTASPDKGFVYVRPQLVNGTCIYCAPNYLSQYYGQLKQTNNEVRLSSSLQPTPKLSILTSMYFDQYINRLSSLPAPGGISTPPTAAQAATVATYLGSFQNNYSYYDMPRLGLEYRQSEDLAYRFSTGGAIVPLPILALAGGGSTPTAGQQGTNIFYSQSIPPVGLKPETSFSGDIGADIRVPRYATVISTDAYLTNLQGQFITTRTLNGTYNGYPLYTTQIANLNRSRYEGLELSIRRDVPRGFGFLLSGYLQRGFAYDVPSNFYTNPVTGAPFSQNLSLIPGVNYNNGGGGQGGIGGGGQDVVPYSGGYGEISYRFAHDGLVRFGATYYGNNNTYFEPAFFVLSASARYGLTKHLALQVSGYNLGHAYTSPFNGSDSSNINLAGVPAPLAGGGENYSPYTSVGAETVKVELSLKL